jgi:hypothetical protein
MQNELLQVLHWKLGFSWVAWGTIWSLFLLSILCFLLLFYLIQVRMSGMLVYDCTSLLGMLEHYMVPLPALNHLLPPLLLPDPGEDDRDVMIAVSWVSRPYMVYLPTLHPLLPTFSCFT